MGTVTEKGTVSSRAPSAREGDERCLNWREVTAFLPENAYVAEVSNCVVHETHFRIELVLIQSPQLSLTAAYRRSFPALRSWNKGYLRSFR